MRLRKLIAFYQSEPLSKWHGLRYARLSGTISICCGRSSVATAMSD
ncbi:hypothetical protein ABIA43_005469 [Bradyrhizobium sp. USDA 328]